MARAEVQRLIDRMAIPVIAAPMFLVSNPALTLACCAEGIMGSFPAHGTRSREEFQAWLDEMQDGMKRLEDAGKKPAPWAVNLVVHASNPRYPGDLELVEKYKVPVVLTSKGAPGDAIKRIHGWGAVALHDIANRRHAEKALEAGVDGVIAVAGGAGGHTGTINPFALMNEVRQLGDGFAIVLAGGMSTGRDVLAAQTMGADIAYIGTRFIATQEAMAGAAHKDMILKTRATDVFLTA
jgi:nitronate monooxygenase